MIIDSHTHIFEPLIKSDRELFMKDRNFALLYADEKAKIISHRELLDAMDSFHLDCAIAMGFSWIEAEFCQRQNEYFMEVMRQTDGKIRTFGSVPLSFAEKTESMPGEVMKSVRNIKESGLDGIGEIGFYADGMSERNILFLENILIAAREYSLPVCLHVNEPVGHSYIGKYNSGLTILCELLDRYPEVTVILAHWGGGLLFYELMPEIKKALRNCYYDTAASPYLYSDEIYEHAVALVGADKILFGSDYPLLSCERYLAPIDRNITKVSDRNKILGSTIAKVLKIK